MTELEPDGRLRWVVRVLPIVWMALIFSFSSVQSPRFADEALLDLVVKKVGHFVLYAVLAASMAAAIATTRWAGRAALIALLASAAFAVSDEFHQLFTPTRWPSWADVLIDVAGALAGVLGWRWVTRRWLARRWSKG